MTPAENQGAVHFAPPSDAQLKRATDTIRSLLWDRRLLTWDSFISHGVAASPPEGVSNLRRRKPTLVETIVEFNYGNDLVVFHHIRDRYPTKSEFVAGATIVTKGTLTVYVNQAKVIGFKTQSSPNQPLPQLGFIDGFNQGPWEHRMVAIDDSARRWMAGINATFKQSGDSFDGAEMAAPVSGGTRMRLKEQVGGKVVPGAVPVPGFFRRLASKFGTAR